MPEPTTPPWVWTNKSADNLTRTWQDFADWVEWLEDAYAPWVLLPPCWPAHEGLQSELRMFWYWHRWVQRKAANPIDGIRLHQELRRSAQAWRELSGCRHETPMPHRQQIRADNLRRRDGFVAEAIEGNTDTAPAAEDQH